MPLSLLNSSRITRELSHELDQVVEFIEGRFPPGKIPSFLKIELASFGRTSSKKKIQSVPRVFLEFKENYLQIADEQQWKAEQMKFQLKFPFLSAEHRMRILFINKANQECVLACFFISEIISKIIDILGEGSDGRFINTWQETNRHYEECLHEKDARQLRNSWRFLKLISLELFENLSQSLGKEPIQRLYAHSYDYLKTKYFGLASFHTLQHILPESNLDIDF